MTDKEKIEKLSRALRVILSKEGLTLQGIVKFTSDDLDLLDLFDEEEKPIVLEAIQIILRIEKDPPKIKMELHLTVGAKRAAYEASRTYGRCLRGCILNVDCGNKMVLVGGKWESKPSDYIGLWVNEEDLCEPEPA